MELRYGKARHARARPGHPRLDSIAASKDVDGRDKPGHDEKGERSLESLKARCVSGPQLRNKPSITGIETDQVARNRRRFHGTLFGVVADRCPASHCRLDLRVRRFALEFDAAEMRPQAAFRVDRARIERARIEARSA